MFRQGGQRPFTVFSDGAVPNITAGEVWGYIGDFRNVTWQGLVLVVRGFPSTILSPADFAVD